MMEWNIENSNNYNQPFMDKTNVVYEFLVLVGIL